MAAAEEDLKIKAGRPVLEEFTASRWNALVDRVLALAGGSSSLRKVDLTAMRRETPVEPVTIVIQKPKAQQIVTIATALPRGCYLSRALGAVGTSVVSVIGSGFENGAPQQLSALTGTFDLPLGCTPATQLRSSLPAGDTPITPSATYLALRVDTAGSTPLAVTLWFST